MVVQSKPTVSSLADQIEILKLQIHEISKTLLSGNAADLSKQNASELVKLHGLVDALTKTVDTLSLKFDTWQSLVSPMLVNSQTATGHVDLLTAIQSLAPAVTAVIAFIALKNWKRQDRAKREAEFLDSLIDVTHEYMVELSKPITCLDSDRLGITSHTPPGGQEIDGAVIYIQKNGIQSSARLLDLLEKMQPLAIRLRSLGAKGQVFNFDGYIECQNAIEMIAWQFDRIEAFTATLGSTTWNWQHPEVRAILEKVLTTTPDDIRQYLQKNNVIIIEFVKRIYRRLYS